MLHITWEKAADKWISLEPGACGHVITRAEKIYRYIDISICFALSGQLRYTPPTPRHMSPMEDVTGSIQPVKQFGNPLPWPTVHMQEFTS